MARWCLHEGKIFQNLFAGARCPNEVEMQKLKYTLGERASFVKRNPFDACHRFHTRPTFHDHTLLRSRSETGDVGDWSTDDQCTGTCNYDGYQTIVCPKSTFLWAECPRDGAHTDRR